MFRIHLAFVFFAAASTVQAQYYEWSFTDTPDPTNIRPLNPGDDCFHWINQPVGSTVKWVHGSVGFTREFSVTSPSQSEFSPSRLSIINSGAGYRGGFPGQRQGFSFREGNEFVNLVNIGSNKIEYLLSLEKCQTSGKTEYELTTYPIGDSNFDFKFDSSDLVSVFTAGKYLVVPGQTRDTWTHWTEGDWNGDKIFDSTDFVLAFTQGDYADAVGVTSVPEPSAVWLLALGGLVVCRRTLTR